MVSQIGRKEQENFQLLRVKNKQKQNSQSYGDNFAQNKMYEKKLDTGIHRVDVPIVRPSWL